MGATFNIRRMSQEEREQIKQQPTEKSGGAVFNIRPAGVSPTKGQDIAAASKETIGSTVSDMGAGATKLAAAERAENVRGGKNPMFKQAVPQGWEDVAAGERQGERNLYRARLDLELAKAAEDAALKDYQLFGSSGYGADHYGIWQRAKHDREQAETAYNRAAGIPDSLLERIAYTMKGGAKQSVGSNADAMGFAYQIGQNSRDEMNSSVISTAKRVYEDSLWELNDMIAAGKPQEAIERQREIVEEGKQRYEALLGIGDAQRDAGEAARDLAAGISQSGAVDIDTAKRGLGTFGGMLVDAGASLTQSAIDRGVGKLLGVVPGKKEQNVIHQMQQSGALNKLDVTGIKLGQMLPFGLRAFGGGTMEARADGADLQQQMLYGAGMSAIETASEFLSDIVQPFAAVMGSGVTDDVVERAVRNVTNRLAKSETGRQVLGRLLTYGAGGIGEGIEEAIADWAEWQLPRIYGGEVDSAAEVLENSLYDFAVGTLSGLGDPRVLLNRFDSGEPSAERGNRQNGPVFDGVQAKEDAGQDLSGGVRYSLKKFDDGTAFVDVDIDQERFAGLTTEQMQNEAKKAILERFRNKVIGTDYKAFVNKRAAEHYAYPVNRRMDEIQKQDKMQASTELDNIISASVFRENVPDDGRHPAATGGIDKLDTKFRVNGRLYEAEISVLVTERGRLFYDLTKFKDITREIGLTTHKGDAAEADGDVSINSIPQTGQKSKGILSGEERGAESTAVNTNPAIHTPEEQAVIDEYQAAVDDSILSFINKWEKLQNPDYKRKIRMQIGEVTERAVQDVRRLTGIDVTGFEHSISGGALEHIENRHGKDGKADRSMTDRNDLARIGYVLAHYDNVELLNRTSNEHRGADGKQAELIQFRKKVNGTYYVVEAVPDSKAKQMRVVSAYMAKENGIADQVLNMPQSGPQLTPKAPVDAHDSVSSHSIPQTTQKSKGILSGEERGTESAGQQKTAPEVGAGDVVQKGVVPFSEQEAQNLTSHKGVVNGYGATFRQFIDNVKQLGNTVRYYFGKVSEDLGTAIHNATGFDVSGYNIVIRSDEVAHALSQHGDSAKEALRGQLPVTADVLERLPEIFSEPDEIIPLKDKDYAGRDAFEIRKQIDGYMVAVVGVANGKNSIEVDTVYIIDKKGKSPATGNAGQMTDLSHTSETSSGPTSDNSIPQTTGKSKRVLSDAELGAFGPQGQKLANMAVFTAMEHGQSKQEAFAAVMQAYERGLTGQEKTAIDGLPRGAMEFSYGAGKRDAAASLAREKQAARFAPVAGNEAGLVLDDYVEETMESGEYDVLNETAKRLGVRVRFVDELKHGANADIHGSEILIQKDNPNPVRFLLGHEFAHRLQALAPEAYRQFRDLAMGQLGSEMTLERRESYGEQGVDVDYEGAMDELTADYAGLLMEHGKVLEDFIAEAQRRDNRTLLEKVRDLFRELAAKLTGKQREQAMTAEQALSKALMEAEKQAKKNAGKNKTAARSDGETRYSLRVFDDGKRFVDVEAEQAQFDGLTEKQMGYQARQVIKQKFKGKVIGLENRAFVNGKTAEEYSYVKPGTSPKIREAKMRASTELDNLLDAGTNFRTEPDGRDGHIHPEATGDFRYFDTIFKVAGEYYSGIINIEPVARGLLLKDITQIENITQEIRASYGENPQGRYLHDVSMDSIPDSDGKSKGKFSMTGALEFADAVLEAQNNREGQMDEQARRELIRLTEEFREKLIEEYGEIKHGENPAREVHLPRKTGEREKVSQTVRTVLEAQATPETAVPDIERLTMEGVFSHEVYGDEQAVRDAEEIIRDKGMERAYADWRNDIRNGVVSKEHTALGWTLYNNAANEGNTQLALDILQNMVDHQRSAAQALQATRILKTLSPETQLYHVQRSVRNLQEELKKKYKDKAPTLQLNEELAADFLQAETEEARDAAQAALYRDIGRQMPSKFIDKWNAWRYLAMLGNARTHVRNVVGNAGFAPVVAVKNTIATGLETVTDKVSGGKAFSGERGARTKALTAGKALYQAAFDDYGRVKAQVMAGGKYQDFAPNSAIEEGRVIFKSKLMKPVEWARRKNGAALELEDSWFAKPHYAAALASYCKANGITAEQVRSGKGLDKAREYAIREAQKATYRDTNDFSQWVSSIGRYSGDNKAARAASVLVKGILPFRKTPANILARGVEYSPAGLLWNVGRSIYRGYKGTLNTAEFLDGISAGLTGTGLLALGFWLAAEGLVRGAGAGDDAEQEFAELMGHQDYALELPDGTSVTLDWLAPEALPFFVGVNLYEEASRKNGGARLNMADWLAVLGNVSEPMLEMSCLQSLNDLFDFVSYGKKEGSALGSVVFGAITSYLMQALPTIFGQAERSGEDKGMMTYPEANNWLTRDVQYALGKASARVPGLDFLQIPYIDAWGREELTGKPASRVVNNFLNPAYMSKIDESAMEQELMRLYDVTGDKAVFPSRAGKSFTVDKVDKKLTGEEYVKYATAQGQTAYSIVCRLIESKAYEGMDDETKAACVELAYEYAEAYARTQVSAYMPTDWRRKAFTTISSTGVKPEDYICAYQAQKGVGVLKDADEKTIPNSESLLKMEAVYSVSGLTDAQRKAMFADFEVGKSVQGLNRAAVEAQLNRWR